VTAKKRQAHWAGTSKRRPPPTDPPPRREHDPAVRINQAAVRGQAELALGDRVRIGGDERYSGEVAVIERFMGTAIPSAVVGTEGGRVRQARTVDLEAMKRG
jgi:hypothetical protein